MYSICDVDELIHVEYVKSKRKLYCNDHVTWNDNIIYDIYSQSLCMYGRFQPNIGNLLGIPYKYEVEYAICRILQKQFPPTFLASLISQVFSPDYFYVTF